LFKLKNGIKITLFAFDIKKILTIKNCPGTFGALCKKKLISGFTNPNYLPQGFALPGRQNLEAGCALGLFAICPYTLKYPFAIFSFSTTPWIQTSTPHIQPT